MITVLMGPHPPFHEKSSDAAICPNCGANPVRFTLNQGPVPTGDAQGTQLLIAQAWCSACKVLLALQIMAVLAPNSVPDPSRDLGGKKEKLWSPS